MPAFATSSAVDHMNEGAISCSPFLNPAASTNSVATGPGQSAVIVTPVPFSSAAMASLKLQHEGLASPSTPPGPGSAGTRRRRRPCITAPRPRSVIPGRKAAVSETSASTLTRTMPSWRSGLRCTSPTVEKPALLTRISTVRPDSRTFAGSASTCSRSLRSAATYCARTPCRRSSSAASSRSRSSRRATRNTLCPRAASWRANSSPMPLEAPVMRAVDPGSGGGSAIAAQP